MASISVNIITMDFVVLHCTSNSVNHTCLYTTQRNLTWIGDTCEIQKVCNYPGCHYNFKYSLVGSYYMRINVLL